MLARPTLSETTPAIKRPGGIAHRHNGHDKKGHFAHGRFGQPFGTADYHQPGTRADKEAGPQDIKLGRFEHLCRCHIHTAALGRTGRNLGALRDKTFRRITDQQAKQTDNNRKGNPENQHGLL